jgi:hypothetical protein
MIFNPPLPSGNARYRSRAADTASTQRCFARTDSPKTRGDLFGAAPQPTPPPTHKALPPLGAGLGGVLSLVRCYRTSLVMSCWLDITPLASRVLGRASNGPQQGRTAGQQARPADPFGPLVAWVHPGPMGTARRGAVDPGAAPVGPRSWGRGGRSRVDGGPLGAGGRGAVDAGRSRDTGRSQVDGSGGPWVAPRSTK